MNTFEDHLWREFVLEHGDDLAERSRPAEKYHRRPRPRLVVGTGFVLAGTGAVLALALGETSTSPAFAVTRNHDGTVTVSVKASSGIVGANASLRQLGIRAKVMTQVPRSCTALRASPQGTPPPSQGIANAHWTINPHKIPAGRTLVLTAGARQWNCGGALAREPAPGSGNS